MSDTSPAVPADARFARDLEIALRMADAADAVTMARFDAPDLDVHLKADATHVSESDTAAERAIRGILEAELPDDAILGEEYGTTGDSNRTWIIDPIDGTANYVKGIPMWATLIALAVDGVPRVGVVSQPAIGRRWWAAEGTGAWTTTSTGEQRQIHVSDVDDLATASISFQSLQQWEEADRLDDLLALRRTVWRDRAYGDAWPYMLLAEGRLEFVAEFGVQPYDIAAHVPIITEAGGRFTDIDGEARIDTASSLATNGRLHEQFLAQLTAGR